MKKKFTSAVSMVLVICLLFSALPLASAAETDDGQHSSQQSFMRDDVSIEADGAVGALFADSLTQKLDSIEKNNGINISSVECSGKVATVKYATVMDATVLVGIYSDDGNDEMYASGSAPVTVNEQSVNVTLNIDEMPPYYYIKAYIIDPVNNKPLCSMYESPMYTEQMAQFLSETTDAFPEEYVVNFDDDKTNNFAVIDPGNPHYFQCGSEKNKLISADNATYTYVLQNMEETVVPEPGDIFAFWDGDVLYAARAEDVSKSNGTVTIHGSKAALDEVFSYVKIDTSADIGDATYSPEGKDDGVTPTDAEPEATDSQQSEAVGALKEEEGEVAKEFHLNVSHKSGTSNFKCTVEGDVSLLIGITTKLYIDYNIQYIEFGITYAIKSFVSISLSAEVSIPLGKVGFMPIPCITVDLNPAIVFEGTGTLEFRAVVKSMIGFRADSNGNIENISQNPTTDVEGEIRITIFAGIQLTPEISALWGFLSIGFEARGGIELEASLSGGFSYGDIPPEEDVIHTCAYCVAGTLNAKLTLSIEVGFLWAKCLKLKFELIEHKFKITDFYYSFDHHQFGMGTCPFQQYVTKIYVVDETGSPLPNITVNGQYQTDRHGLAKIPLDDGVHEITVSLAFFTVSKKIRIERESKSFCVTIPGKLGNGSSGSLVKQVDADGEKVGALLRDGSLYLWYQPFPGDTIEGVSLKPQKVMDDVVCFSISGSHNAAVKSDGSLYMWGYGGDGQLGNGSYESSETPVKVLNNVKSVALSRTQSAAITNDGQLYLWGSNLSGWFGERENPANFHSNVPVKYLNNVKSVSMGWFHGAAVTYDGDLYTWGINNEGQLGDGTTNESTIPRKVMEHVKSVSCTKYGCTTAAVTEDGSLYTWGSNAFGQLGNGGNSDDCVTAPVKIADNIQSVSLEESAGVYITNDNKMYIWGDNLSGPNESHRKPWYVSSNIATAAAPRIAVTADDRILTYTPPYYYQEQYIFSFKEVSVTGHTVSEAVGSGEYQTAVMKGYQPNCVYNFYAVKSDDADDLLASDNLLYVNQIVTDDNGEAEIWYIPTQACESPYVFMETFDTPHITRAAAEAPVSVYNGEKQTWSPVLTCGEYTLKKDVDYEISGESSATNAGVYTVKLTGKGRFRGHAARCFVIQAKDISRTAVCTVSDQPYSGEPLTPAPTVTVDGQLLQQGRDYTVTYENNSAPGTGRMIVEGTGNYTGTLTADFRIVGSALKPGDANGDGDVTIADATEIQKHLAQLLQLEGDRLIAADTNGDGYVTISDATHLQRYLAEFDVVLGKP